MTDALTVEAMEAGYGSTKVLHGLSFSVAEGSILVILGANGAGKTTTLRALSGMVPSQGTIELFGESTRGLSSEKLARRGLAHVPEGRGTFKSMTVEENLKVGALSTSASAQSASMNYCFELFPRLAERKAQKAGNLSGGEQQMLAISRALMSEPRLLMLDEPSLGLAPLTTRDVFEALRTVNEETGLTVIVVEQNANLALDLATEGIILVAGLISVQGRPAELAERDDVRRAYLGA